MDIKPQLLETLKLTGELPVSKMKKLIHVQEDFVQFQEIKKIGKDEKIANLKDEMNKRKMELEKQKMAF